MTHTALLPAEKAGRIQKTIGDFNCELTGFAIAAENMVNVTVAGDDENVKALFESIGETINDETTE